MTTFNTKKYTFYESFKFYYPEFTSYLQHHIHYYATSVVMNRVFELVPNFKPFPRVCRRGNFKKFGSGVAPVSAGTLSIPYELVHLMSDNVKVYRKRSG